MADGFIFRKKMDTCGCFERVCSVGNAYNMFIFQGA